MHDPRQTDTAEQAKQKGSEVVDQAKRKGAELTEQAKQQGAEMVNQAKEIVNDSATEVKHQAESRIAEQKQRAADQLSSVAGALRQTSKELHTQDKELMAEYADTFADQIDRFSVYLNNKEVGDFVNDVQKVARRQPELFVAGALAAGFLIGRFFKSSGSQNMARADGNSRRYPGDPSSTRDGASSSFDPTRPYRSRTPQESTSWNRDSYSPAQEIPVRESETRYGQ